MESTKHEQANDRKWSDRSRTYDEKRFNYFRFMQKRALSFLSPGEGSSFLDLGCGTGWAVRSVAEKCNGKGTFVGIDISAGMIAKAKANARGCEHIMFYQASAESLPLESDFFHSIICTNSFHHYLRPARALGEVYRVLRQKGKVCILDVTSDDFFITWINGIVQKKEKEHVNFYNSNEYKSMFENSGLRYIKSKTIVYPLKIHVAEK
jgi:ubiquinone/menaquinone biosynthesis C-methylase UbiE